MQKTFYVQLGENNKITDIISFPHEGYTEIVANIPLPTGVMGGAYQLVNGTIIYKPEWDKDTQIEELKAQLDGAIAELTMIMAGGTTNV